MTPSSLKKMKGGKGLQEGTYASSIKNSDANTAHHDLGLTLLPKSQILGDEGIGESTQQYPHGYPSSVELCAPQQRTSSSRKESDGAQKHSKGGAEERLPPLLQRNFKQQDHENTQFSSHHEHSAENGTLGLQSKKEPCWQSDFSNSVHGLLPGVPILRANPTKDILGSQVTTQGKSGSHCYSQIECEITNRKRVAGDLVRPQSINSRPWGVNGRLQRSNSDPTPTRIQNRLQGSLLIAKIHVPAGETCSILQGRKPSGGRRKCPSWTGHYPSAKSAKSESVKSPSPPQQHLTPVLNALLLLHTPCIPMNNLDSHQHYHLCYTHMAPADFPWSLHHDQAFANPLTAPATSLPPKQAQQDYFDNSNSSYDANYFQNAWSEPSDTLPETFSYTDFLKGQPFNEHTSSTDSGHRHLYSAPSVARGSALPEDPHIIHFSGHDGHSTFPAQILAQIPLSLPHETFQANSNTSLRNFAKGSSTPEISNNDHATSTLVHHDALFTEPRGSALDGESVHKTKRKLIPSQKSHKCLKKAHGDSPVRFEMETPGDGPAKNLKIDLDAATHTNKRLQKEYAALRIQLQAEKTARLKDQEIHKKVKRDSDLFEKAMVSRDKECQYWKGRYQTLLALLAQKVPGVKTNFESWGSHQTISEADAPYDVGTTPTVATSTETLTRTATPTTIDLTLEDDQSAQISDSGYGMDLEDQGAKEPESGEYSEQDVFNMLQAFNSTH